MEKTLTFGQWESSFYLEKLNLWYLGTNPHLAEMLQKVTEAQDVCVSRAPYVPSWKLWPLTLPQASLKHSEVVPCPDCPFGSTNHREQSCSTWVDGRTCSERHGCSAAEPRAEHGSSSPCPVQWDIPLSKSLPVFCIYIFSIWSVCLQ